MNIPEFKRIENVGLEIGLKNKAISKSIKE